MPTCFRTTSRQALLALAIVSGLGLSASQANAAITWYWNYAGNGISAGGTLITADAPDSSGFYQITDFTGSRNGDAITGLYPTGTAIPGNEPYALDNLIRIGPQDQVTVHGLGFATASGHHANPYFADFLATPGYVEVFTTPSSFSELPITFSATPVPEAAAGWLSLAGLLVTAIAMKSRKGETTWSPL